MSFVSFLPSSCFKSSKCFRKKNVCKNENYRHKFLEIRTYNAKIVSRRKHPNCQFKSSLFLTMTIFVNYSNLLIDGNGFLE